MKALLPVSTFVFAISFFPAHINAQTETPDTNFGNNGITTSFTNNFDKRVNSIAAQADGKIVAGGVFGYSHSLSVLRYLNDGTPDASFGIDSSIIIQTAGWYVRNSLVALSPEEKIYCASSQDSLIVDEESVVNRTMLLRFKSNGTPDDSFAKNGKLILDSIAVNVTAVQPDGKILLAGTNLNGAGFPLTLARILPTGIIDSTFGTNGYANYTFENVIELDATVMQLQPDGKIIITGQAFIKINRYFEQFFITRIDSDSRLDSTFGTNGVTFTDFSSETNSSGEIPAAMWVKQNGKILVTGTAHTPNFDWPIAIAQYNADGTTDESFGSGGKSEDRIKSIRTPYFIEEADDNKFLICSQTSNFTGNPTFIAFTKYNADGSRDITYGDSGLYISASQEDYNVGGFEIFCSGLQADKKILLGGRTFEKNLTSSFSFALFRFNNSEVVLPVSISSFTASKKENLVLLNWKTCSEINSKGFYVERSNNNTNWTSLGYVASKGGGYICNNEYSFTDTKPLNGNNFYRLKQVDNDGKFTYSKTVSANFIIANHIKISPNPVKDILMIEGLSGDKKSQLTIINASGKVLETVSISGPTYNWNLQNLPSGLYYLTVEQDDSIISKQKFIKEN